VAIIATKLERFRLQLLPSQIWERRYNEQQMLIGPTLMEGIKRTNVIVSAKLVTDRVHITMGPICYRDRLWEKLL